MYIRKKLIYLMLLFLVLQLKSGEIIMTKMV